MRQRGLWSTGESSSRRTSIHSPRQPKGYKFVPTQTQIRCQRGDAARTGSYTVPYPVCDRPKEKEREWEREERWRDAGRIVFHTQSSLGLPLQVHSDIKAQILVARGSKELGQAMNHHPDGDRKHWPFRSCGLSDTTRKGFSRQYHPFG